MLGRSLATAWRQLQHSSRKSPAAAASGPLPSAVAGLQSAAVSSSGTPLNPTFASTCHTHSRL